MKRKQKSNCLKAHITEVHGLIPVPLFHLSPFGSGNDNKFIQRIFIYVFKCSLQAINLWVRSDISICRRWQLLSVLSTKESASNGCWK